MNWKQVGLAARRNLGSMINIRYTLESGLDDYGIVRYRVKNIATGAIVSLEGNSGTKITPYIYRNGDTWFPMRGYPYIFSSELPGWFIVKFHDN